LESKNVSMEAADYGLDAPQVVRNLLIGGGVGLLLSLSTALKIWSGELVVGPFAGVEVRFPLGWIGLWSGTGFLAMGFWMIWSSKIGKVRKREGLLNHIAWTGREQALDVGCGRGLMLIGAAKRLTSGKAIGIDKWQAEDLSDNRPEATLENARREKVADLVEIKTGDMRELPFQDASFDVVLSCAAIHNIYSKSERDKAIGEIARVLKPGGQALIDDIRHLSEYADAFALHGCKNIHRIDSRILTVLLAMVTVGSLRPGTLLVRKSN
jgi:arsenite methyltransferase